MKNKNENLEKIFDFLHIVNELKKSIRYGEYDIVGDSGADHSWRLALMIFIFIDELKLNIDILKAMKIAIVHDLPEAITGDIAYMYILNGTVSKEEKHKNEIKAMNKLKQLLPEKIGKEINELWEEYEYSKSKEALFVKALDKIETISFIVEKGKKYNDLDLIATYPDKHVKNFPELIPVLRELKIRLKKEFEKRGLIWKPEYDDFSKVKNEELIDEVDWDGNVIGVHKKSELKEKMFPHKVTVIIPKGQDNKVVLCRRAKDQYPFPDTWCCAVGGKVIHGENLIESANREMKEEIGCILDIEEVAKVKYNEEDYKGIFYIFTTKEPVNHNEFKLDLREIQYTREFMVNEILDMVKENPDDFAPTFREIIKEFAKKYKS